MSKKKLKFGTEENKLIQFFYLEFNTFWLKILMKSGIKDRVQN